VAAAFVICPLSSQLTLVSTALLANWQSMFRSSNLSNFSSVIASLSFHEGTGHWNHSIKLKTEE
jgi:hypothetical protein